MSERIDHAAKVGEILRGVQELMEEPSDGYQAAQHVQNLALSTLTAAQVHATLAMVEEQRIANEQARIANLIALGSLTAWESELPGHPIEHLAFAAIGDPDSGELRPEIREALGL